MESVNLHGTEDVLRAGRMIDSAADTIQRAANNIDDAARRITESLREHSDAMDRMVTALNAHSESMLAFLEASKITYSIEPATPEPGFVHMKGFVEENFGTPQASPLKKYAFKDNPDEGDLPFPSVAEPIEDQ